MKNIGNMMRQAQEMQTKLGDMQARLAEAEIAGSAGGGMVTVLLNGKGEARKVTLDAKVVDANDVGMLEDLIVAAFNDARKKIDAHVESETQKIMGGMMLPPGFKLPM